MGNCKFCGSEAGILRKVHSTCAKRYKSGKERIIQLVAIEGMKHTTSLKELRKEISSTAINSFVRDKELNDLYVEAWTRAVRQSIDDYVFTSDKEMALLNLANQFSVSPDHEKCTAMWSKFQNGRRKEAIREAEAQPDKKRQQIVAELLRKHNEADRKRKQETATRQAQLAKKRIQEAATRQAQLAKKRKQEAAERKRKLDREEAEKRLKQEQELAERNKKRTEERVAREKRKAQKKFINDIWIGKPFQSNVSEDETPFNLQKSEWLVWTFSEAQYLTERTKSVYDYNARKFSRKYYFGLVERGYMGVTTKHIYFVGDKHRFRIRFDRIVAFKEYPDGVGLNRARHDATHEKFVTDDGWFTYKLVNTLARLYSQAS